jgi:arylsulfatase A-like enzyme
VPSLRTPERILALALVLASLGFVTPAGADPPPNFVIVNLDDTRFDGIDAMPVVQQRLIDEGFRFENSFVPNSLCCPSRASLLSGFYAARHGTRQGLGPIGGARVFREVGVDRQSIAVLLQDAGYRTGLFGKYLNSYGGSEATLGPGGTFYVPPGWDRWWAFQEPSHYGGMHGMPYQVVQEDGSVTLFDDDTSDAEYSTDLSAQEARDFVSAAVAESKPFFVFWTPYASHVDGTAPPAPADRHLDLFASLAPWRPPSWNEADVSDKPRWVQLSGPDLSTDLVRRRAYETLLSVDEQIEAFLDLFVTLGVDGNTLVLLTSDNGVGWGEHGLFNQTKQGPYEEYLRVPLVVRYPAGATPPVTVEEPVLNIDVLPTLLALAGIPAPAGVDGVSFDGFLQGTPPSGWRTDFLIEQWRHPLEALLTYTGQPMDGDQIRVFYGDPLAQPRPSKLFEFDAGGGVGPGAIAVPIGGGADASFVSLGLAVVANVPSAVPILNGPTNTLTLLDISSSNTGLYFWVEVDQGSNVNTSAQGVPSYFGVRDVAQGWLWVEYETGERELYDLALDPDQLENRADDPTYASVRAQLEARLDVLRPPPFGARCADGFDADGDGLVDYPADPGCQSASSSNEAPQCNDGADNDNDSHVDLADPQCTQAWKTKEAASNPRHCGLGLELVLLAWPLARLSRRRLGLTATR